MNVREGAGTGALLLYAGGAGRLAEHPTLSDEDNVTVRELLLELTGQPVDRKNGPFSSCPSSTWR